MRFLGDLLSFLSASPHAPATAHDATPGYAHNASLLRLPSRRSFNDDISANEIRKTQKMTFTGRLRRTTTQVEERSTLERPAIRSLMQDGLYSEVGSRGAAGPF